MSNVEAIADALAISQELTAALQKGCYVESRRRWLVWQRLEWVVLSRDNPVVEVMYTGLDLAKALQVLQVDI